MKFRKIGTGWQLDPHSRFRGSIVVSTQALANVIGCDTHDRVGIGVVADVSSKQRDAEQSLFDFAELSLQSPVDDVEEKLLAPPAATELIAD
jgi:hypothetical protein